MLQTPTSFCSDGGAIPSGAILSRVIGDLFRALYGLLRAELCATTQSHPLTLAPEAGAGHPMPLEFFGVTGMVSIVLSPKLQR